MKVFVPLKQVSKYLFSFFLKQHLAFIALIIAGLAADIAVKAISPFLSRWIIDTIIPQKNIPQFYLFLLVVVCFSLAHGTITFIRNILSYRAFMRPMLAGYLRVFKKTLQIDEYRDTALTKSRLLQISIEDIHALTTAAVSAIPTIVSACVQIVVCGIICFSLNRRMTILALCIVPLNLLIQLVVFKIISSTEQSRQELYIGRRNFIMQTLQALHLVKLFNAYAFVVNRYKTILKNIQKLEWVVWKKTNLILLLERSALFIRYEFWQYGLYLVVRGSMTLGNFTAIMMLLSSLTGPLQALTELGTDLLIKGIPLDRMRQLDRSLEKSDAQTHLVTSTTPGISIQNLSFSYQLNSRALDSVSLVIPAGAYLGITGPTGSGKSTLARLLCGLETRAYEGTIMLDNIPYANIDRRKIRETVLMSEQDIVFGPFSVFDNITLGKPINRKIVEELCIKLGVHTAIQMLPKGYDTDAFGEYELTLSGGQAQLIAIARCLLHDPVVAIFDEATSAMDLTTEQQVLDVICEYRRGKTTLIISHRLHALRRFKLNAVLMAGKLIGFDSPENLSQTLPYYKQLAAVYTT